jgi:nitroreductase
MSDVSLFDTIHTQRAIRLFTADPVDDALIERMIQAATRAPSARNSQPWRFIVVRDQDTKARLGALFDELGQQYFGADAPPHTPWSTVPVLIVVCAEGSFGTTVAGGMTLDASVFPAVQNLLLAGRALGLGTVLTTRWKAREADLRPLLGVPEHVTIHAIIPTGWPATRFGPTRRRPVHEVTFRERFGAAW